MDLAQVLRHLPDIKCDANLLVGANTFDDAGVWRLCADLALVQTVDFFTPVVDDPYTFGQIAAANALSDIYAMGGQPLTCLNIAAFPKDALPLHVLGDILRGGIDKVNEAGATVVGGHTINDDTPKYGLAVTGLVHPDRILTNAGGKPGDILLLSKPLGAGILTTAMKRTSLPAKVIAETLGTMRTLNKEAARVALTYNAHACTDITGFGLLGHLHEMANASHLAAKVEAATVPLLPQTLELAEAGFICGGSKANLAYANTFTHFGTNVSPQMQAILSDAITSGGLLIALPASHAANALTALRQECLSAAAVGTLITGQPGSIYVT